MNKLQTLQTHFARIAANSPYDTTSQPLLTIRELIDMATATMVYREAPNYLSSLFERLSQNTIRELQNSKTDLK